MIKCAGVRCSSRSPRRILQVSLVLIAAAGLSMPVAAQASSSYRAQAPSMGSLARTTLQPSTAHQTRSSHVMLPSAQCASLRRAISDRNASCMVNETVHTTSALQANRKATGAVTVAIGHASTSASTTYFYGYLEACAQILSSGYCNTKNWWTYDYFTWTQDSSGQHMYNYSTPYCNAGGTNITWCSYTNNGQNPLVEGFNFGNGGWARVDVYDYYLQYGPWSGSSWAQKCGLASTSRIGLPAYCY